MKSPSLLLLAFSLLGLPTFGSAQALVDPLATVPGFAPTLTFSESITETLKTTVETTPTLPGEDPIPPNITRTVVTTKRTTLTLVANITGLNLANLNADTEFSLTVGALSLAGSLGDDPTYTPAKKTIFIPARLNPLNGNAVGTTGVRLTWTTTRLTVNVSFATGDDAEAALAAAGGFAGSQGSIRDSMPISVAFAGLTSQPRLCYLQGTCSVRTLVFGPASPPEENIDLNTVSLTGAFDLALPTISITSPLNNSTPTPAGQFTLKGKAGDGHRIARLEYTTNPATTEPWIEIVNITDQPPALPNVLGEAVWGTTNKAWELALTGQPFGTNRYWVRAIDETGNRSAVATIALVHPVPVAMTGRWDSLVAAVSPGVPGYLTFTCDVKGGVSGKLTLEGTAAPLSFVGAWLNDSFTATIKRAGKPSLLLAGQVNSTSPASLDAAVLTFTLTEVSATTGESISQVGGGSAFRCPYSATNKLPNRAPNIAPAIGRFNVAIAAGDGSSSPAGCGYFSMLVADTGLVTVTGRTADGATLTMSSTLGAGGQVPVFVPLYANRGSLFVLEKIDMTAGTLLPEDCTWRRPAAFTDKQFPSGFDVELATRGERYTAPAVNARVMGLIAASPNASAVWQGDAVANAQTQALEVTKTHAVISIGGNSAFRAAITSATGIVSGSLNLSGTTTAAPWFALIVGNRAEGHYIAPPVVKTVANRFGKISLSGEIPQLAGSDDFNDNLKDLSKWRSTDFTSKVGSVLTEINQRLEYTCRAAVVETDALRPWTRNFGALSDEFDAIVDVRNAITPPSAAPNVSPQPNASIGLTIYNSADFTDSLYLELYRGSDGFYFLSALSNNGSEVAGDASEDHLAAEASLRLHYDPTTRVITAYYDDDGAINGYVWTELGSFGIGGSGGSTANAAWSLTGEPVLGVGISAFAQKVIIPSGQVHADNFQVNTSAAVD